MADAGTNRSDGAGPRKVSRRFPYLALFAWLLFALVVPCLTQSLNFVAVLAFPLGFFMAAQGSLIALALVAILSARRQDRVTAAEDA